MASISDDEQESPPSHRPTTSTASNFVNSFDDAFSDTEDNDVSFEFSPAVIRAELAKNMSNSHTDVVWHPDDELDSIAAKIGFADPDTAAPTFNVGGHIDDDQQLSPPTQQPPSSGSRTSSFLSQSESFDEVNLTSEFSSVSLESPLPNDEREEGAEDEHEPQYASYPAVEIDTSQNHPVPTVVRTETPTVEAAVSPSPSVSSRELPPTPGTAAPLPNSPQSPRSTASTTSLPMPSTPSGPTPSSSHSQQASASTPSFAKHRPTRSVGPSMLDKVISKTRPTYLPPKPRVEDRKHMADWETMMKRSRAAGEHGRVPFSRPP